MNPTPAPQKAGVHFFTFHVLENHMSRRDFYLRKYSTVFPTGIHPALVDPPLWVQCAIGKRIHEGSMTVVSAVCPDYERKNDAFTYRNLGEGVPFIANQHLEVLQHVAQRLAEHNIACQRVMTLADTEFDLPLVVQHMAGGNREEFLRRCQASCEAIMQTAHERNIPLESCSRFTATFADWFANYHRALAAMHEQTVSSSSVQQDLRFNSANRVSLYCAMTGSLVSDAYCQDMVLRQWAQYAAWGESASTVFGTDMVMLNHTTPNLTRVNEPSFRAGRERIPILQLRTTTMPG